MNNQEMIDVIQADIDGKLIECQWKHGTKRKWEDKRSARGCWKFEDYNYRVKARPIVIETWQSLSGRILECVAGSTVSDEYRKHAYLLHMAREVL